MSEQVNQSFPQEPPTLDPVEDAYRTIQALTNIDLIEGVHFIARGYDHTVPADVINNLLQLNLIEPVTRYQLPQVVHAALHRMWFSAHAELLRCNTLLERTRHDS